LWVPDLSEHPDQLDQLRILGAKKIFPLFRSPAPDSRMQRFEPLVVISDRGLENLGYVVEPSGGNPVLAVLDF